MSRPGNAIPPIPPNTDFTVEYPFHAAATASGTIPYSGFLYDEGDGGSFSGSLTINPRADVAVELTAADGGLLISTITYTIRITNNGPSALTSANVRLDYPPVWSIRVHRSVR